MNVERLRELLKSVRSGETDLDSALTALRCLPYEDLGFAKVDHHRALRTGFPEVLFCQGKSFDQIAAIAKAVLEKGSVLLATRADEGAYDAIRDLEPSAVYHREGRIVVARPLAAPAREPTASKVLVITAGTADIPVAEEAAVTAETVGASVERLYDVGVAGLHRLLAHEEGLRSAAVLIVVAGMEGALASVVGGLVDRPVIAVPTSVGYGASFNGLAALLCMLNTCAAGVVVVNIDNGFGAGYFAAMMVHDLERASKAGA